MTPDADYREAARHERDRVARQKPTDVHAERIRTEGIVTFVDGECTDVTTDYYWAKSVAKEQVELGTAASVVQVWADGTVVVHIGPEGDEAFVADHVAGRHEQAQRGDCPLCLELVAEDL